LPELKKIELTIGKNFIWNKSLVFAEKLEEIKLTGTVYPPLPQCLPELEGLKTFSYRSLGNPKDEMPLPEYLWKIEQLNKISLFGKTIPMPKGGNFANLKHLKELELNYINWDHLPESISTLSHLDKLSIFNFIKLKSLPNWFANLKLTTLSLSNCKLNNAIELVSKMPNLKRLIVSANIQKKSTEEIWKAALPNVELTFIK
jgi:Leucine-rich repeat (LRR) protein